MMSCSSFPAAHLCAPPVGRSLTQAGDRARLALLVLVERVCLSLVGLEWGGKGVKDWMPVEIPSGSQPAAASSCSPCSHCEVPAFPWKQHAAHSFGSNPGSLTTSCDGGFEFELPTGRYSYASLRSALRPAAAGCACLRRSIVHGCVIANVGCLGGWVCPGPERFSSGNSGPAVVGAVFSFCGVCA